MGLQNIESRSFTAGEALSANRLVKFTSSNTVKYADEDDEPQGVVMEDAASGEPVAIQLLSTGNTYALEAAGVFHDADLLYACDDGKVDDDSTKGRARFKALAAASGAASVIECLYLGPTMGQGLLASAIANGTSVENTVTETTLASKTIDGGELQVGDVLEIIAAVFVEDNNSTDTLEVKLKVGTEEIITTGAVDVADNDVALIHAFVTVRATGASGSLSAMGTHALGVPGTVTAKPFIKAAATEDISGDVIIKTTATWSAAHADNECESRGFVVIKHRQ